MAADLIEPGGPRSSRQGAPEFLLGILSVGRFSVIPGWYFVRMLFRTRSVDEMASRLREVEAEVSDLRCEQAVLVNELDKIHLAGRSRPAFAAASYQLPAASPNPNTGYRLPSSRWILLQSLKNGDASPETSSSLTTF